MTNNFR